MSWQTTALECGRKEINYKRRQSFFSGSFDWNADKFYHYHKYKRLIGSAIAQTVIRKNNEVWKSFFALLRRKWNKGEIKDKPKPPDIGKIAKLVKGS